MSLRLRTTLFFSFFLALILVLVAFAVYTLTERSLLESAESRATGAMTDLLRAMQTSDPAAYDESVRGLSNDVYLTIKFYLSPPRDARAMATESLPGRTNRTNPTPQDPFETLSERDFQMLLEQNSLRTMTTLPSGLTLSVRGRWITYTEYGPDYPYRGVMLVGVPTNTSSLVQLRSNLIRVLVSGFALFAVGVWFLAGQVLKPVRHVTSAANRVSSQDLSQRVPVPESRDEMAELATTLNNMLGRLQESFETQRRFTADASHELRTPVTAIVGHANYLLRRTKPSAEQTESLSSIKREGERMAKLVNDLLELAKADAGSMSVERQPMNLVEVVESVRKDMAPVARGSEVSVFVPHPVVEVEGDFGRLKQVVVNLVQNAINAGSKHVNVSLGVEKAWVRLEVLDDGPGIPAEAIPRLFDRFFRVDSARSTRGNGSGLGLAIVNWIVQQHQGEVTVESRVGEGTVFTVLLPALDTTPKTETRPIIRPQGQPVRS